MIIKVIISRTFGPRFGLLQIFSVRSCTTVDKQIKLKEQTDSGELVYDEVPIFEKKLESEERIQKLRNKSRLNPSDHNRLYGKKPYSESMEWYHDTLMYKRKTFGRYGLKALDATPGIAWPTEDEVEDLKEYEKIYNPLTLQENWKLFEERKQAAEEAIRLREQEIDEKLKNMNQWKQDLQKKIDQKQATETAARLKKEKMMEEIRQHFGVNVDPRSDKFKELMAKKMEEDTKRKKALKKEEKAARQLKILTEQMQTIDDKTKSEEIKTEITTKNNETKDPKIKIK
ncbi:growth arrest and DNA damage-inducible proteins-interacting protein 1 isoform X2 [Leptopilina boulardi]|nr:growth arrest and DNA damage-inducible proteins-interacting protein 1 isoform X2 [Leptopilina boulardi]